MPVEKMTFVGNVLTDPSLDAVEQALGVKLPVPYRRFLLTHNGGRPHPRGFSFADQEDGSLLDSFYSVECADRMFDLVSRVRAWRARVPNDLIAIGIDAGGSLVCLGVQGPRSGKVYFWSLEDESDPRDPTNNENVWLCADDFDGFLASFREPEL
ncbi:MAG: SMI1/KNR4 family protein [Myxococcales bacterium]|nr:SMI1/KNR4 family protein [Myxococcales bacterium]